MSHLHHKKFPSLFKILTFLKKLPKSNLKRLAKAFQHPLTQTNGGAMLDKLRTLGVDPEITAWLIMGSNDLIQVKRAYTLWKALEKKPKMLCFSGYGGHGTIYAPIFSHTEADSMSAYFEYLAKQEKKEEELLKTIVLRETHSTNTGQNAEYIKELLDLYHMAHLREPLIGHFVIFGTPPAITRQVLTIQQTFNRLGYPFETISSYPPDEKQIEEDYFSLEPSKPGLSQATYHLCALRECAVFFDYAIRTEYLFPWAPSREETIDALNALNEALLTLSLAHEEYPLIEDTKKFAEDFLQLIALRSENVAAEDPRSAQLKTLIEVLSIKIEPMAHFFRSAWTLLEESMTKLDSSISLEKQTETLAKTLKKTT